MSKVLFTIFAIWLHIGDVAAASKSLRLASLSPLATELLYELGQGPQIVMGVPSPGVPESQTLPRPGEWFAPSLERLVKTRVDWVITNAGALSPTLKRGLQAARLPVFVFDIRRPGDLVSEAERFFREVAGTAPPAWIARWQSCAFPRLRSRPPFRFLALVWGDPPILFGRPTFLSQVLEALGGTNLIPPRVGLDYPQISLEWLRSQSPDAVYLFDEFLQIEDGPKIAARLWPGKKIELRILPAQHFGRSAFTVFDHLSELFPREGAEVGCERG